MPPVKQTSTDKPDAEEIAEAKVDKPDEGELTFSVERLQRQASDFFGADVQGHDVAGAFASADPSTEVTLSDAKQRIKDWKKATVKTDEDN